VNASSIAAAQPSEQTSHSERSGKSAAKGTFADFSEWLRIGAFHAGPRRATKNAKITHQKNAQSL
jgi:hypothetical protein